MKHGTPVTFRTCIEGFTHGNGYRLSDWRNGRILEQADTDGEYYRIVTGDTNKVVIAHKTNVRRRI